MGLITLFTCLYSTNAESRVDSKNRSQRPRVLMMSEAYGYTFEQLAAFCGSFNGTSGPLGVDAELVLIDPSFAGGPLQPLSRPEEFRAVGVTVVGQRELESYIQLLARPEWAELRRLFECTPHNDRDDIDQNCSSSSYSSKGEEPLDAEGLFLAWQSM